MEPLQVATFSSGAPRVRSRRVTCSVEARSEAACRARSGDSPAITSAFPRERYATLGIGAGGGSEPSDASAAILGPQDSPAADQPRLSKAIAPSGGLLPDDAEVDSSTSTVILSCVP